MGNYITNTFDGFSFGADYKQVFQNKPVTTLMHEEIIRMRFNGLITDEDLKVIKFIFDFKSLLDFYSFLFLFHLLCRLIHRQMDYDI